MSTVQYKPAEVLQWFNLGSREAMTRAKKRGKGALQETDIARGLKEAAGAAFDFGKGAWTDAVHRSVEMTEYVLGDDGFEVVGIGGRKRIAYTDVREVRVQGSERAEIVHSGGSLTVKPVAHLLAGRLKVPVGWLRNGMEVPYALLIEELAARCGVDVVEG
ncbi:MAG: hypothetical protein KF884_02115 [Fimbriimonadaceae bacterium]|nr:hypothetical protein [Fimbriimonadaceae bacterium]QYK58890.1 MAG: hypothetical protein KF884_02115 [Fimbriimonadaceae bacterium]